MITLDTGKALFAGKLLFSTPDKNNLVSLPNAAGNMLDIETGAINSPGINQQFNVYGDLENGFLLQAPNWAYVCFNNGYAADRSRTDAACSVFSIQSNNDDHSVSIIEAVSGIAYFVVIDSANANKLNRVAKGSGAPPSNARFIKTKITDSLADMLKQRSTLANSLTGAYLSGQDLHTIAFMNTDVSFADLSHTILDNTNFNAATASSTIFDQASLNGWIANGLTFNKCSFTSANMNNVHLFQSVMAGCTLNKVNFQNGILQDTDFTGATLVNCTFNNAKMNGAIFKNANLTNSDLSQAKGVNDIKDFTGATLIATNLSGHDLRTCLIDSDTTFISAVLEDCNLQDHDLSNVVFLKAQMKNTKLDNTNLNGVQMPFADLSFATVTGAVSMIGANLSNANLKGAQFPGAQLGAKKTLYALPLSDSSILDKAKIPPDLQTYLKLSPGTVVEIIQPGNTWRLTDAKDIYQVNNTGANLLVQTISAITNAGILTNAYMENTNFQQANMYAAELSGVYWFGGNANAQSADLGEANLSNAFLANMHFKKTLMQGANFAYSTLIGTVFDGAVLSPGNNLKPTSFAFSSLQSAKFTGTNIFFANLTNAAFGLEKGVPLFTIEGALAATLNNRVISQTLQTVFANAGYPLIPAAAIKINSKSSSWTLNNIDAENIAQTGYGNLNLELVDQTNGLNQIQVYGAAPLLLLVADGKGGQTQEPLNFGYTGITQDQMNDYTTCPSGMKLLYLNNHITYEEIMTAVLPPQPPDCLNCWG